MKTFTIYLAGAMGGLSKYEMNGWRLDFISKINIQFPDINFKFLNPVDFYSFELEPVHNDSQLSENQYNEKEVMEFDLHLVKQSDIVVVNLNFPQSTGTNIELFQAYYHLKIPVLAFINNQYNKILHPWTNCCISRKMNNMYAVINYIGDFYIPTIK